MMDSEHTETSSEQPDRPARSLSKRKKLLFASLVLFACYATAELVMTILYMRGFLSPAPKSTVVLEQASEQGSTRFDPIRGCYLTSYPARTAIVASNGKIEAVGTVRGNNQGFPDRDDFQFKRGAGGARRYAVFGDSMTAAQFLARNWPDTAEDMAGNSQQPLELYNFSIFGGGLDNWHSVIVDHLDAKEYELDGVIFAVCCDDLHRSFTFWDDSQVQVDSEGRKFASYGRIPSRDKLDRPANFSQASLFISPINCQLLSSDDFDRLLAGETRLTIDREFKLYLTSRCVAGLAQLGGVDLTPIPKFPAIDPNCLPRMDEIALYLQRRRLPCLVVQVPMHHELLARAGTLDRPDIPQQTLYFADRIGAEVVDGSAAFSGLDAAGIRNCWLPHDGHWGQPGSDRFAVYMLKAIQTWQSQ